MCCKRGEGVILIRGTGAGDVAYGVCVLISNPADAVQGLSVQPASRASQRHFELCGIAPHHLRLSPHRSVYPRPDHTLS